MLILETSRHEIPTFLTRSTVATNSHTSCRPWRQCATSRRTNGISKALSVIVPAPDSPCWMHLSPFSRDPLGLGALGRSLVNLLTPHLVHVLNLRPRASPESRTAGARADQPPRGRGSAAVRRAKATSWWPAHSPATFRHHLREVYAKLGGTSKVQMARLLCGSGAGLTTSSKLQTGLAAARRPLA